MRSGRRPGGPLRRRLLRVARGRPSLRFRRGRRRSTSDHQSRSRGRIGSRRDPRTRPRPLDRPHPPRRNRRLGRPRATRKRRRRNGPPGRRPDLTPAPRSRQLHLDDTSSASLKAAAGPRDAPDGPSTAGCGRILCTRRGGTCSAGGDAPRYHRRPLRPGRGQYDDQRPSETTETAIVRLIIPATAGSQWLSDTAGRRGRRRYGSAVTDDTFAGVAGDEQARWLVQGIPEGAWHAGISRGPGR